MKNYIEYTKQLKFITFDTIGVRISESKLLAAWNWKKMTDFYKTAPHFESEFGPKRFSKFGPNPAHKPYNSD